MKYLFCFFSLVGYVNTYSQKAALDFDGLNRFMAVGTLEISQDAKYAYYSTRNGKGHKLFVQANDSSWVRAIPGAGQAFFTANDRYLLFTIKDSVGVIELTSNTLRFYPSSGGFKTTVGSRSNYAAWKSAGGAGGQLVVWSAEDGKTEQYGSVDEISFSDNGKVLVFSTTDSAGRHIVNWCNCKTGKCVEIWKDAAMPRGFKLSDSGSKLAFGVYDTSRSGGELTRLVVSCPDCESQSFDIKRLAVAKEWLLDIRTLRFSPDNARLFFKFSRNGSYRPNKGDPSRGIDIWRYNDAVLPPERENNAIIPTDGRPRGIIDLGSRHSNCLMLQWNERVIAYGSTNKYLVYERDISQPDGTQYLHSRGERDFFLFSLDNGTKTKILADRVLRYCRLTGNDRYLVYFDQIDRKFYSYDIETKKETAIGIDIPYHIYNAENRGVIMPYIREQYKTDCFVGNKQFVLLTDDYDIWLVDVSGKLRSINVTGGYGRKNRIELSFQENVFDRSNLHPGDTILLKGVNQDTFLENFYSLSFGDNRSLRRLSGGMYASQLVQRCGSYLLVRRSAPADAPNWYLSKDLVRFKQLTNLQPQKLWNWYTKKQMRWRMSDGEWGRGILYVPENFDPTKKYPVIFEVYEGVMVILNSFEDPAFANGSIEAGWEASRGYLVFMPDINFTIGQPGESAYRIVASAASYLSTIPWVDGAHMGISGGSMGGYEINYIVTRTGVFAAAAPSSGMTDFVSAYGALRNFKDENQFDYETDQSRIHATLWQRPDLFIKNSPIFSADKVTTPLLILHNKLDPAVPWAQGVEWFMGLRRLGKKAWMLQYDGEDHGVFSDKNVRDYTTRLDQFFDHYLRGAPFPEWMKSEQVNE